MSIEASRPSTLGGIKSLAKAIKSARGIPHMQALDEAARIAGYQNFRHARKVLSGPAAAKETSSSAPCVFLTAYWIDQGHRESGRETLKIQLSSPWNELVTPAIFGNHRALARLRVEAPDHLVCKDIHSVQSEARRELCAAARALQFMDATKLRPTRKSYSSLSSERSSHHSLPGRDHTTFWYDRESKLYLLTDEPYERSVEQRGGEREAWARRHGFTVVKSPWAGMYAPDIGSQLYLVSHTTKGVPLPPIVAALAKLQDPIIEGNWNGESAPMRPVFVTPAGAAKARAKADAIKNKPKALLKPRGPRNTIGYVQTFAGPQRRPKGSMSIDAHAEVGRLLNSVLAATYRRKGVYNRIRFVRSELDEWVQREYDYEALPNERFQALYYGEMEHTFARSLPPNERANHVISLAQSKKLLTDNYPDSAPLRSVLKKIDAAVKSLESWE